MMMSSNTTDHYRTDATLIALDVTYRPTNTTAGIVPIPEVWVFVAGRPVIRAPRFVARRMSNRWGQQAKPSTTEVLTDMLAVLEDIRDDMRAVRNSVEGLEPADLYENVKVIRDRVELATDRLADARARFDD